MTRRRFLQQLGSLAGISCVNVGLLSVGRAATHVNPPGWELVAGTAQEPLVGMPYPHTDLWGFNQSVPGSEIRVPHAEPLTVRVLNSLTQPSSVHWHGIRLPWAMDGVAGLTQAAIEPGEHFDYHFTPPDAGTFWYHAHANTPEQVGRGLYGPLIIEEASPIVVDRELVWMLDDWRLTPEAAIVEDFANRHDRSHGGRLGNTVTVNGRRQWPWRVRSGERLRLRLINAANARQFALDFGPLAVQVIAIDGQPVAPYPLDGLLSLPSAGRVDLAIDLLVPPSTTIEIIDRQYREPLTVASLAVDSSEPLREQALDEPVSLGEPTIPTPDLSDAIEHEVIMAGGAMGGLRGAYLEGQWMNARTLASRDRFWALNEIASSGYDIAPMISVPRGRSVRLSLTNDSAFVHPMHLHGHHMQLLSVDGQPPDRAIWHDTISVEPRQRVEVAFVADNPGRWLFHCHVLEHHSAGMGAIVEVL